MFWLRKVNDVFIIYCSITNFLFPNSDALQDQRNASVAGIDSTIGESSLSKEKTEENYEPLGINLEEAPKGEFLNEDFHIESGTKATPSVEQQFIESFSIRSPILSN